MAPPRPGIPWEVRLRLAGDQAPVGWFFMRVLRLAMVEGLNDLLDELGGSFEGVGADGDLRDFGAVRHRDPSGENVDLSVGEEALKLLGSVASI